jgi:hypothetical protein
MAPPCGLWDIAEDEGGSWADLPSGRQTRGACHPLPAQMPPSSAQPVVISAGAGWSMISAPVNLFVVNQTTRLFP